MKRLILIDDDNSLHNYLQNNLGDEDFEIVYTRDTDIGLDKMKTESSSIIILNIMLPGRQQGLKILQHFRAKTRMPIIILTSRRDEIDCILGLEMGADDYLIKPFNPRELLARIRAVLRRTNPDVMHAEELTERNGIYIEDDVELNSGMRTVIHQGKSVYLTAAEFDMLDMLIRHAGEIVSREELAKKIFNRDLATYDRSIDVHICNLRKKFDHAEDGAGHIKSIRGKGYIYIPLPPALHSKPKEYAAPYTFQS